MTELVSANINQPLVVQGGVPAFLLKLWKIVEEPAHSRLISWTQDGKSFKVHDPVAFAKEILPKYYKHNNFSSFVRQVNMYGFRKIIDTASGSLKLGQDEWEFFHQNFRKGKPDLLQHIKRKVQSKVDLKLASSHLVPLLQDIEKLKHEAEDVNNKFELVKSENELLWREVSDLRDQHHYQQNVINKLIQFFVQLVMGKSDNSRKRPAIDYPMMQPKVMKMQELQPYNPSTTALQFLQDRPSFPLSPVNMIDDCNDDCVIKLLPDTITELNEPIDSETFPLSPSLSSAAPPLSPTFSPDLTSKRALKELDNSIAEEPFPLSPSLSTAPPSPTFSTQEQTNSLSNNARDIPESPFIFPDHYTPTISSSNNSRTGSLMTPVVVIPSTSPSTNNEQITVVDSSKISGLSTPVVHMSPAVSRQASFADRSEISDNVEKISKSIDLLQDILSKKQISLDLKHLDLQPLYNDIPTQVSVQDLIRLSQRNEQTSHKKTPTSSSSSNDVLENNDGQLIPYTEPFSPSQLLDSHYGHDNQISRSDFLQAVLDD